MSLSLNFVIVGGSISGLTAAFSLAEAGHRVTVLEKTSSGSTRTKGRGALRCPPNLSRIFQNHPLAKKAFLQHGVKASSLTFRDGTSLELLGRMMFSEELMRDCGADFYLHTYDDLHTILLDLCQANNVTIHYDKDVTHVERTQDGVRVLVCNGGKFDADVLVAADGRDSVLRSSVSEAEFHETANLTGLKCWVPFSRVAQDPELALLADENIWTGFLAPGFAFNISAFPQNDEIHLGMAYLPQDAPNVIPSFHTLHPSVQKFLELGKDTMVTGTFPEYKVEEWVGLGSRGILIGDAAHASTIYSTYNTSMSVEDGAVLAELFADVTTYAQIPFLLSAFEEIRQPRANTTSYTEYMRFLVLSLPDGPEKEQRNMALGATLVMKQGGDLDLGESEMLAETWSDFVQAYAYDSKLAAREWLQVWGKKVKEH